MKSTILIFRNGERVNTIESKNETQAQKDLLQLYKHFWQFKTNYFTTYKKVKISIENNITFGEVAMYSEQSKTNLYVYNYIIEE